MEGFFNAPPPLCIKNGGKQPKKRAVFAENDHFLRILFQSFLFFLKDN